MIFVGVVLVSVAAGAHPAHGAVTCPTSVSQSGGDANDTLDGTNDPDRIAGNGGNDRIRGFAGSDCLNGGSFDDEVFGGDDDDLLTGEGGNDLLDGGDGDDEIIGGSNDDEMDGGDGDDRLFGEGGDDEMDGGDGDDLLAGGSNNDLLTGGPGRDTIFGGGGDDTIVVRAGDVPDGGAETISGESGIDTVVFNFEPGSVSVPNFDVADPETGGLYRVRGVETVVVEICGDGDVGLTEECDDGNELNGDGCDANCTRTACGNGIITAGEQCDDGNLTDGDGCDAGCLRELCENGECVPDDPDTDGPGTDDPGTDDPGTDDGTAECRGSCDDGDACTVDRCHFSECVSEPLPNVDRALCNVAEIRASCTPELSQHPRLARKVQKLKRVLRLLKTGESSARLERASTLAAAIQERAARIASSDGTPSDCSATLGRRLDDLAAALGSLHSQ